MTPSHLNDRPSTDKADTSTRDGVPVEKISRRLFGQLLGMPALMAATVTATATVVSGCGGDDDPVADSSTALPAAGELSRAQFVALISDSLGWYHQSGYNDYWKVPVRSFVDVKASDTYGKEIENAYEENVIAPDAAGKFNPQAIMTREDAAVIFAKAFLIAPAADNSAAAGFSDAASISDAAKPSVAALVCLLYTSRCV